MDDRRFDSLTKALAQAKSRRSVLKGLLGLGGAAAISSTVLESGSEAARRPTPTPKPVTCPGQQTLQGGQCACPPSAPSQCGPDCCNPAGIGASHSECCDNACCFGHCYGEELCCDYPLVFCEAQNECCGPNDNQCCGSEGCCDTACCPVANGTGACCEGATPKCCPGNACIPESGCCSDDECPGCQTCQNNVCTDDNDECVGCLDCVQASCVTSNGNCGDNIACTQDICGTDGNCSSTPYCTSDACCEDGFACNTNTCNVDGTCAPPVVDCRNPGCACFPTNACYVASCNQETGQCEQVQSCSAECCAALNPDPGCLSNGRCTPGEAPPGSLHFIGPCYYDLFCADSCCSTFSPGDGWYCETEGSFAGQCVNDFSRHCRAGRYRSGTRLVG